MALPNLHAAPPPSDDPSSVRSISPRRGLPGGRSVVGGLLVALAALGTFVSLAGVNDGPTGRVVVAARDLTVGTRLTASDLDLISVDLPVDQAALTFADPSALVGRVVLAPIGTGEVLQTSSLADAGVAAVPTLSLSLEAADALGGTLRAGDRVDVYVSFGSGYESSTRRVATALEVVDAGQTQTGLGEAGDVQLTVGVEDAAQRIDLVNATHAGTVTLVRVSGARNPDGTDRAETSRFSESPPALGAARAEAGADEPAADDLEDTDTDPGDGAGPSTTRPPG